MPILHYSCACFDCKTCALGQHCGMCRDNNRKGAR